MIPTPADYFGLQVRATRKRKGWTQDVLAERLAELGAPMHPTAITKLEKGQRNVSVGEAFAIAAALDVSPLALLLPRKDDELVAVTPGARPLQGEAVRGWVEGSLPITAFGRGESGWETLDGRQLTDSERDERTRFYESEVSDFEWRRRQSPGLAHLRTELQAYERARDAGADPGILRSHLDLMAAELDRQRADVERAGNEHEGS